MSTCQPDLNNLTEKPSLQMILDCVSQADNENWSSPPPFLAALYSELCPFSYYKISYYLIGKFYDLELVQVARQEKVCTAYASWPEGVERL